MESQITKPKLRLDQASSQRPEATRQAVAAYQSLNAAHRQVRSYGSQLCERARVFLVQRSGGWSDKADFPGIAESRGTP